MNHCTQLLPRVPNASPLQERFEQPARLDAGVQAEFSGPRQPAHEKAPRGAKASWPSARPLQLSFGRWAQGAAKQPLAIRSLRPELEPSFPHWRHHNIAPHDRPCARLRRAGCGRDWEAVEDVPQHCEHTVATVAGAARQQVCLLYTSPSPRDQRGSRMPSSA